MRQLRAKWLKTIRTGAQGYPVATRGTARNIFHLKINFIFIQKKYPSSDPFMTPQKFFKLTCKNVFYYMYSI